MNIVVASHGTLCDGLVSALDMMVAADTISVVPVGLDDRGIDDFRGRLSKAVEGMLSSGPTLIMSDLIGGTPYNESFALMLLHPDQIRVVSGTNFPMLIEVAVAAAESNDLDEVTRIALEAGRSGVSSAELPADSSNDEEDLF